MQKAMDRSVQLLTEYADASGFEETIIEGDASYTPVVVKETLSHCNELLGTQFTMEQVQQVLTNLDFKPEVNGDEITCHIPSYRTDIARNADIDEEIIRLIGFDELDSTLPLMSATVGQLSPIQTLRRTTKEVLTGFGLHEIVTYTLVGEDYIKDAYQPSGEAIALAMPMSEARKYVRTSLMNSVLECVQYNEAHQNTDNHFFELSSVYAKDIEDPRLALVLDGKLISDPLHKEEEPGDYYALKGIVSAYLNKLGYGNNRIQFKENETDVEHFHPYRSAEVWCDKTLLGVIGNLHPTYAKKFDLKDVVYGELRLLPLMEGKTSKTRYSTIERYPSVSRDIAFVVEKNVKVKQVKRFFAPVKSLMSMKEST